MVLVNWTRRGMRPFVTMSSFLLISATEFSHAFSLSHHNGLPLTRRSKVIQNKQAAPKHIGSLSVYSFQEKISSLYASVPPKGITTSRQVDEPAEDPIAAGNDSSATDQRNVDEGQPKPIKAADAASIIAGTAIGGGFLALPSVTGPIGYLPAACGLILAWSFLLLSATAFIEAAGLIADMKKMDAGISSSETDEGATSLATVLRFTFGKKTAVVGGFLFVSQMLAVVTAQVVKGAELFSDTCGFPYLAGCLVPTILMGTFAFGSKPEVVERANTVLTAMMVGGFIALIIGTVATGGVGAATTTLLSRADFSKLLPNRTSWAFPVFINMLCFGQAMPLVVERMVQGSQISSLKVNGNVATTSDAESRNKSLFRARKAASMGAAIPLILTLIWAAISTALVSPTASNPLQSLLSMSPLISVPVGLLATGAIGTTLLGSFLAMRHFASDVIFMKLGSVSKKWMVIGNTCSVAVPTILSCFGPALYLPLLAFAGAYPTTILHGLSPVLSAFVLRRRARKAGIKDGMPGTTPRIVPGGDVTLAALAGTAVSMIAASTYLAIRHIAAGGA